MKKKYKVYYSEHSTILVEAYTVEEACDIVKNDDEAGDREWRFAEITGVFVPDVYGVSEDEAIQNNN